MLLTVSAIVCGYLLGMQSEITFDEMKFKFVLKKDWSSFNDLQIKFLYSN